MKPARNTVYGVPFLDQQKKQTDVTFNKPMPYNVKNSQEFEKIPGRVQATPNYLNIQNASSEKSLTIQENSESSKPAGSYTDPVDAKDALTIKR